MNRLRSIMFAVATVVCTTVMAQNTITQEVYWLDGDVSTAQAAISTVDISGLLPGLHSYSIRVKDSNGLWSSIVTKYFVIPYYEPTATAIAQREYWIDGNVAARTALGDSPAVIAIGSLSSGLHSLTVRVKDDAGRWSSAVTKYFIIPSATESSSVALARYMYWIDGDVAYCVTGNVSGSAIEIDFSALSEGTHTLSWRVSDTKGAWGSVKTETFTYSNITTAGDWNVAANWNTGIVPAAGTDVTIAADITIPSGYIADASNITIADGGSLTIADGGQLIHSNIVNVTTEKNPEKATNWGEPDPASPYIPDGWYFIASPADGASFGTVTTGDYDLYVLNNATMHWLNQKNQEHAALFENGFQRGTGYLYATNEENVTLQFSGEAIPYESTYTIPLEAGWNLVGNPFTRNVVPNQSYLTLVNAASTTAVTAGSGEITPGMGIAVYSENGGTLGFTLPGEASSAPSNNIQMTLSQTVTTRGETHTTTIDNAIVSFNENERMPKFDLLEGRAKLYIPKSNNDYAIAFSNRQGEVPVYFKAKETGRYTISVETHDCASLQGVKLIDKFENVVIDLGVESSYTFIGTPADSRDRFIIRFENSENFESSDFAYQNGTDIIVNGNGELQIFDVMGRLVSQQYVNGIETIAKPTQTGVYIFKLEGKTQKIVIK
ncbi:MAG: T9SS type A sorting domain-containing protein [Bacteroidales bacterium]|nr:T9SS type A sorting domain-containing protein [Bacteroidales bacterium]